LRLFSFGGYGLPLAALALVVFGAYDSYPQEPSFSKMIRILNNKFFNSNIIGASRPLSWSTRGGIQFF